jgi:ubiquinone/menaquinone biosynthesis C-methylase UbiE
MDSVRENVSEFYGSTVEKTDDLYFSACYTSDYDPDQYKHVTEEVLERRYGCESPIPEVLEGKTLVDLGSGAGPDCFIAAKFVGPEGLVIGVDMTDELLTIARRNIEPIMKNLGYDTPNVRFDKGHIEKLPLEDNSVDVVISNCVINLSPQKQEIFDEIWRVLKPGGEFFISDIVSDRRIDSSFNDDPRLHSECYTGAAYIEDLNQIVEKAGFQSPRISKRRKLTEVIDGVSFESIILRGFKLDLEPNGEDYAQMAIYRGTIEGKQDHYTLDLNNEFPAGAAIRVSKNTADILLNSRFAPHFVVSNALMHLGAFDRQEQASQSSSSSQVAEKDTSSSNCC